MSHLLDVRNLETSFRTQGGSVKAVNNVSFELDRGRTLGIVGESGSGKSVTALSIMRLVADPPGRITGGQLLFDGSDLLKKTPDEMSALRGREIAMIFQDPMTSLNPVLTIGRQLTESLRRHLRLSQKAAEVRAVELLTMVGIPSAANRLRDFPHQFSGGMRQRVMIAIALSCNPKLLIADEPTTALDVTIQAQILELIARLQKELNTSVILITHDLGVIAGLTDEVIVMYAGRVVERGPTNEIFADPRMPYTIGLLRSIPRLDDDTGRRLTPIQGSPPDLAQADAGCPFRPRCAYAVAGTCDAGVPPLRSVGPKHLAACFFDITLETPVGPATAPGAETFVPAEA